MLKEEFPKMKMSRHFQLEANMTLSGLLLMTFAVSTADQKQALVHIYNVVTGSSVAVN
jgi:molybdopterin-containing oxidoreductase family iron-sulfur binding subunit